MDSSKCRFCESYESWRDVLDFKREHPEYYSEPILSEIVVALVVRQWCKGLKRQASRVVDYRFQGCGYALNFCPECGRPLKEKRSGRGNKV